MRRLAVVATLVLAMASAGGAQKPAKACAFDTAAHTDTLTLEFSLRAYRGDDTIPDPVLTRGLGDIFRAHFVPTQSIGRLFYPNTYLPIPGRPRVFTLVFSVMQFTLSGAGAVTDRKWFATSDDATLDDALDAALQQSIAADETRMFAGTFDAGLAGRVMLRFLATNDTIARAALFRIRVPLLRVDAERTRLATPVAVPADLLRGAVSDRSEFSAIIDPSGKPVKASIHIVAAPSLAATLDALLLFLQETAGPFKVGGCPVAVRIGVQQDKRH